MCCSNLQLGRKWKEHLEIPQHWPPQKAAAPQWSYTFAHMCPGPQMHTERSVAKVHWEGRGTSHAVLWVSSWFPAGCSLLWPVDYFQWFNSASTRCISSLLISQRASLRRNCDSCKTHTHLNIKLIPFRTSSPPKACEASESCLLHWILYKEDLQIHVVYYPFIKQSSCSMANDRTWIASRSSYAYGRVEDLKQNANWVCWFICL